jgi:hypothetical protein
MYRSLRIAPERSSDFQIRFQAWHGQYPRRGGFTA